MTGELQHFGIKGMKWGIRRYQNSDGTLTEAGKKRYGSTEGLRQAQERSAARKKTAVKVAKAAGAAATTAAVVAGLGVTKSLIAKKALDVSVRAAFGEFKWHMRNEDVARAVAKTGTILVRDMDRQINNYLKSGQNKEDLIKRMRYYMPHFDLYFDGTSIADLERMARDENGDLIRRRR